MSRMRRIQILEVPGLGLDLLQRGDLTVHLSELMAVGDLREIAPSVETLTAQVGVVWPVDRSLEPLDQAADRAKKVTELDGRVGKLRARGGIVCVVSCHGGRNAAGLRPGVLVGAIPKGTPPGLLSPQETMRVIRDWL